jgi:hypothetical protein
MAAKLARGAYRFVEVILTAAISVFFWEIFWFFNMIKGYRPTLIQNIFIAILSTSIALAIMSLAIYGRKKPFLV